MNDIMTPEEYVYYCIENYPSLYALETFEEAKFKVFNYLFNAVSNGIHDNESLLNRLKKFNVNIELAKSYLGASFFSGYPNNLETDLEKVFPTGDLITVPEWEKENHPEVKVWFETGPRIYMEKNFLLSPYKNFKEIYSTLYKVDNFKELGQEWIDAAIWFYEKCSDFLNSENLKDHPDYSFPSNFPEKDNEKLLKMYSMRSNYSSDEEFSKAYDCSFDGGMKKFLTSYCEKENKRCISFINKTLEMLNEWKNEINVSPKF